MQCYSLFLLYLEKLFFYFLKWFFKIIYLLLITQVLLSFFINTTLPTRLLPSFTTCFGFSKITYKSYRWVDLNHRMQPYESCVLDHLTTPVYFVPKVGLKLVHTSLYKGFSYHTYFYISKLTLTYASKYPDLLLYSNYKIVKPFSRILRRFRLYIHPTGKVLEYIS